MSAAPKRIKVLLYGNISARDYRSRLLFNFLLNSRSYCVSQVFPAFYNTKPFIPFLKITKYLKILILLYWLELLYKAAAADVIYLLPMNNNFIKSAIWAKSFFKKKLVTEMYISLYDTSVRDRNRLKIESKEAKIAIEKDRLALTGSDYIIPTSTHELSYWGEILDINVEQNKVFVAPVCNISPLVLKRNWRQDGILKICWWGSFIPLHGLDSIFRALKILQQNKLQFTCDLFGVDNDSFPQYAEKLRSHQLCHVELRKDLSFTDGSLPNYLINNCDLALGIFGNTDKALHAVPNKLIEALAMGIPTLTMNSPALWEFFNPETDLWTCEPLAESIAESILQIASGTAHPVNWEQTRQKVLQTFSIARYQEVVKQVLERATNNFLIEETTASASRVLADRQPT